MTLNTEKILAFMVNEERRGVGSMMGYVAGPANKLTADSQYDILSVSPFFWNGH